MLCKDAQSGMTLPEVLISVAILAIGSVYVLRALSTISYTQALTETRAAAYLFSASKMAEVAGMVAAKAERKKQSGSFYIEGERGFHWSLKFNAYDADLKLDEVDLNVEWQHGVEKYNYETRFLALPDESNDKNFA